MEAKKAYGLATAIGTRIGERARDEPGILAALRATSDVDAFRTMLRALTEGRIPPAVVDGFCDEVVTAADWIQWRSRVLIQAKLTREGGKPAPGHETGRGVRRP